MQTTTINHNFFSAGPRVVEQSRGSAHRRIPTTRPSAPRQPVVVNAVRRS
jgi:hypothetical protein